MKKILIATKNKGKVAEFAALFEKKGYTVQSLLDLEGDLDVEETGVTFEENAILKAEEISKLLDCPVVADDSGLEVDALNGEPGVYSARYAGLEKSDEKNIDKVLEKLEGIPDSERTARFQCALALALPGKDTVVVRGNCEGVITHERVGEQGFGYDPIFYVPSLQKTLAELPKEEKNKISHRAKALQKLEGVIDGIL
ncbi:XTP/dITP diphosphatase [Priestia endophytica]|uniref:XTP/dITP diphosphatase n=1 Tax=Priestia endophytica TaxID=135735 RepID=UPI000DCA7001|nr:XTP/dITP diphosphatase [Priestia endophytica]RAS88918.1 non-canonical purine NTP pyrophosphatase [Priestia endophytica]